MTIARTFITGDTHGFKNMKHLTDLIYTWEGDLTKKDVVIICGDAGLTWFNNTCFNLKYILGYTSLPCTIVIVDGNHDNFDTLYNYPEIEKFGGPVYKLSNSVFYLQRGYVYTINDQTFFAFGGARSTDKLGRIEHEDWWHQEIPSLKEMIRGFDNLNNYNYKIDFIITHTCGHKDLELFEDEMDTCFYKDREHTDYYLKSYIDEVKDRSTFQRHYCGHFHEDIVIDKRTTFLFESYYEITNYP